MHEIEPHYTWRHLYIASEDQRSPFFGQEYSEFEFSHSIYNYVIHPQWDQMGSSTLYLKLLYADYQKGFCIIELIGEWNDCLHNDIMYLKRNIAEALMEEGINQFILIMENVLNFHGDEDDYYQEWFDELEDGWIAMINLRDHIQQEIVNTRLDYYLVMGGNLNEVVWRSITPQVMYDKIKESIMKRLHA